MDYLGVEMAFVNEFGNREPKGKETETKRSIEHTVPRF